MKTKGDTLVLQLHGLPMTISQGPFPANHSKTEEEKDHEQVILLCYISPTYEKAI